MSIASVTGWTLSDLLDLNIEQLKDWGDSVDEFQKLQIKAKG